MVKYYALVVINNLQGSGLITKEYEANTRNNSRLRSLALSATYIQMQERIRAEEKAVMERQRKDDIEKAELERHAQQKAHETQIQMLQDQLAAMASVQ